MAVQLPLQYSVSFPKSFYEYGKRSSGEGHGVVLTKRHIVEMMLDISGYRKDLGLIDKSLLEPSCGHGAFLLPAIHRFFSSSSTHQLDVDTLKQRFLAYDINEAHVKITRRNVYKALIDIGIPRFDADMLANSWVRYGDFLLENDGRIFDFVIGNPPYIRIEQLSPILHAEYRSRYSSLFDRADIYVAFIEHGLDLLKDNGSLTFICADRWILNKYGEAIRRKISDNFAIKYYIDLHEASPFETDVIAYPAIFTISSQKKQTVHITKLHTATPEECKKAACNLISPNKTQIDTAIHKYDTWFNGSEPWVLTSPEHLKALRSMENRLEPLENHGDTKVRIGVATGNDKIYIVSNTLNIESDRLIPIVKREDLVHGKIIDSGRSVINTFIHGKGTINLDNYPRLKAFFIANKEQIKKRYVAKKNPNSWFRTIDRVYPEIVKKPKLLIPDIAGSNEIVYDEGRYYPHHNLYFITSSEWDLEVLGGLLSSRVALFFIWSYAVKMRGKYLRFQAQYLRRICIPKSYLIPKSLQKDIKIAFRRRDFHRLDAFGLQAYGLDSIPDFDFVDTRK
ncbi:MAG: putative DNA modification methyltransferase [Candidatus Magnetoglobus multicellularis str. Araruama]|uniref:site-specific DNA-methyltransferase (adenine-specific) n=1 Tax=Candidatus Magnetoglobus multicellularis str. Araruama TaxID=890399 RepID=A0A1V1PFE7_9BACT|nr:MAG: putative DNA modification methyltransferase [Candidatus Magnetoglobus multicellularis str. Araruama]